jgi:hypothetical protein
LRPQRLTLSHRELTGIVFTHVCGGGTVNLGTTSQQWDALAQPVHLISVPATTSTLLDWADSACEPSPKGLSRRCLWVADEAATALPDGITLSVMIVGQMMSDWVVVVITYSLQLINT